MEGLVKYFIRPRNIFCMDEFHPNFRFHHYVFISFKPNADVHAHTLDYINANDKGLVAKSKYKFKQINVKHTKNFQRICKTLSSHIRASNKTEKNGTIVH